MTLTPERLQRLVKHRERLERLQEIQLGQAQRKRVERQRALDDSRRQRHQLLDSGPPASGAVDPDDLWSANVYLGRLDREIGARQAALAHSIDEVAVERERLLERRRDRRAVETLLERRQEEEHLRRSRADIKRIDELATRRWLDRAP
jgi:flagellar export protein FliJ